MQPCFSPAKLVKTSVNLLSILNADLSFEYMDIKTSRKRPCTPYLLSLSNSFCQGIQSKAFLNSTKHEKSKYLYSPYKGVPPLPGLEKTESHLVASPPGSGCSKDSYPNPLLKSLSSASSRSNPKDVGSNLTKVKFSLTRGDYTKFPFTRIIYPGDLMYRQYCLATSGTLNILKKSRSLLYVFVS